MSRITFMIDGRTVTAQPGQTVVAGGVTILGPVLLAATMPFHASQQYGRNVLTLLQHLSAGAGTLQVDPADEITGPMLVVHQGRVR